VHPVFADPKTDFVFKRIFGAEARKPLWVALLNHLLELEGDRRILDVQYLSGDRHVDVPDLKLSIVDVKCTDATGRRFVVEMQVLKVEGFEKRVVYNASKAYEMQLHGADEYPVLCGIPSVLAEEPFRAALEVTRMASFSSAEWEAYERAKMAEQDARGALSVAREEGAQGRAHRGPAGRARRGPAGRARRGPAGRARRGARRGPRRGQAGRPAAPARAQGLALTEDARARIAACTDVAMLDRWFDNALTAGSIDDVLS
jgi:hypothetical protein